MLLWSLFPRTLRVSKHGGYSSRNSAESLWAQAFLIDIISHPPFSSLLKSIFHWYFAKNPLFHNNFLFTLSALRNTYSMHQLHKWQFESILLQLDIFHWFFSSEDHSSEFSLLILLTSVSPFLLYAQCLLHFLYLNVDCWLQLFFDFIPWS